MPSATFLWRIKSGLFLSLRCPIILDTDLAQIYLKRDLYLNIREFSDIFMITYEANQNLENPIYSYPGLKANFGRIPKSIYLHAYVIVS